MSGAAQTQIDQYKELRDSGELSRARKQVYDAYKLYAPCTRQTIREQAGIPINKVSGRTTDLLDGGWLKVVGKHPDKNREILAPATMHTKQCQHCKLYNEIYPDIHTWKCSECGQVNQK